MDNNDLSDIPKAAEQSLNAFTMRIEGTFAEIGGRLGQSHEIFERLRSDLEATSHELSGADIESASAALETIAKRLKGLAESLPLQVVKLKEIFAGNKSISDVLRRLVKNIQLVTIIARSARIEAVALSDNRGHFLDFTQEVQNLAKQASALVQTCEKDQQQLAHAISSALTKQSSFDGEYREQLLSLSEGLISAYSEIRSRQTQSSRAAAMAASGASRISAAVGQSIVSLQAGDSVRQRLEHICAALHLAADREVCLAPLDTPVFPESDVRLLLGLQADQLSDTVRGFEKNLSEIGRGLEILSVDATKSIEEGRALYSDGDSGMTSFLDALKLGLAQALSLIGRCDVARKSVEETAAMFEATLQKFQGTVSELSEAVADIILVGMNASLKAAHLGAQGNALVVIANELGATASQISNSADMLKPILSQIGLSADDLNALKLADGASNISSLEGPIAQVVANVSASNEKLVGLMNQLSVDGGQFKRLVSEAQSGLAKFAGELTATEDIHRRLASLLPSGTTQPGPSLQTMLESQLYPKYTMAEEREIHRAFCQRLGWDSPAINLPTTPDPDADDVLFF